MSKVLIIANTSKEDSINLSKEIRLFLKERNINSVIQSFDGFSKDSIIEGYDFVITLGGDGTVLYAARNCVEQNIPVFPVNLGQFGFMAPVQQNEWKEELKLYFNKKAAFQERIMLKAQLIRDNKTINTFLGLNDFVISARYAAKTITLEVNHCEELLCKLKADGLIVSTPTGSTAYSSSAGGPIVDPLLEAIVLTPLNAFSLSSRPIVLSSKETLEINVLPCRTKEICITADGQEPVELKAGDKIKISCLDKKIKLISCTHKKYYSALRSKLNWRGEPHAGRINN